MSKPLNRKEFFRIAKPKNGSLTLKEWQETSEGQATLRAELELIKAEAIKAKSDREQLTGGDPCSLRVAMELRELTGWTVDEIMSLPAGYFRNHLMPVALAMREAQQRRQGGTSKANVALLLTDEASIASDLREQALDCLTPAQRRIVEQLEKSKHFVYADTLKVSPGCFRKLAGTTDRAVASQIEAIQASWDEHEIPWSIKSRDNAEKPAYKLLK